MIKPKFLLFVLALLNFYYATAQVVISGKVVVRDTEEPLHGATIRVLDSKYETLTKEDGTFKITVPNMHATIKVSYIGMQSKIFNAQDNCVISLYRNGTLPQDEVIVIAYGQATKASFAGSVAKVTENDIANRQVSNVSHLLTGVSGIETYTESGQPGTGTASRIRGIGSINADNSPLYVVDGMSFEGHLATLNLSDIESISVLKDASAAALYGSRGANGVIIITTKKGKEGKPRIEFNARIGANSRAIKNYNVIKSPQTYLETVYQAMYNAATNSLGYSEAEANMAANMFLPTNQNGGVGYNIYTIPMGESLIGIDGKINPNAKLGYSDGTYFYVPDNWQKETFQSGLRQQYDLSVSGGMERLNYYLSMGFLNDEGIIKNSDLNRFTFRTKVEGYLARWLKIGSNMSYSITNSKYPSNQTNNYSNLNAFFMANSIAPIYPLFVRDANGEVMRGIGGMILYDYGDGNSTNGQRSFMPLSNPVAELTMNKEKYQLGVFNGRWYATVTPLNGLTMTAQLGMNIDNTRYNRLRNPLFGSAAPHGTVYQQQMETRMFDYQYLANYNKIFGKRHFFDIMIGYDGYEWKSNVLFAQGSNLYLPFIDVVGNTIDQRTGNGNIDSYSTIGIISRLNYDYANTYFLNLSYRHDGSSRFAKKHRWGDFYSIGAAWIISKEPFMAKVKDAIFIKLKASYGEVGNDNIRNYYAYTDQYYLQGNNGQFSDGSLYYKGNSTLTWEKSSIFNTGVEFDLFHGLLSGSIEYFSRKVTDMLFRTPVAPSSGYNSIYKNIGAMTNSGIEVNLSSLLLNRRSLKWTITANATLMKNRINKLPNSNNGTIIDYIRIYEEGKSMLRMYLVKFAGVDHETGQALYWAKDEQGEYTTTDWSVANATNKQPTKDFLPTIYGGFGTQLSWKGFDFSLQCSYQLGGKIYDEGYRSLMHNGVGSSSGMNWHNDILKAWTSENRNTNVPRLNLMDKWGNADSDRWVTSSDYLSLNNITIGYTIPKMLLSNIGMEFEKIRLFFSAENPAFVSARKGLDPRHNMEIGHAGVYSPIRSFVGGINITF